MLACSKGSRVRQSTEQHSKWRWRWPPASAGVPPPEVTIEALPERDWLAENRERFRAVPHRPLRHPGAGRPDAPAARRDPVAHRGGDRLRLRPARLDRGLPAGAGVAGAPADTPSARCRLRLRHPRHRGGEAVARPGAGERHGSERRRCRARECPAERGRASRPGSSSPTATGRRRSRAARRSIWCSAISWHGR